MNQSPTVNLEELEQKTSLEFVKKIKRTIENVSSWEEKEIQFFVEEDPYTLTVLMCFFGSICKYEYRFSTGTINHDQIYWSDIRNFFDISLAMKKA